MLLIDDRPWRPPQSELPAWEPNWRVWSWVLVALVASGAAHFTAGFASYVFVLVAFGSALKAIDRALPYKDGLREYRQ